MAPKLGMREYMEPSALRGVVMEELSVPDVEDVVADDGERRRSAVG